MSEKFERKDGFIYMTRKLDPSDWDYDYLVEKSMSTEQEPDATSHVTDEKWEVEETSVPEQDPNAWVAEPLEITHDPAHADLVEAPAFPSPIEEQLFNLTVRVDETEERTREISANYATVIAAYRIILAKVDAFEQRVDTLQADTLHKVDNDDTELETRVSDHDNEITELKDGLAYLRRVVIGSMPGK